MKRVVTVLMVLIAGGGCATHDGHDHSTEHPPGHDHHEADHGHEQPMLSITRWTERFEVFLEHPEAQAGQELALLIYVTVLDGFRPFTQGTLSATFQGPAGLTATATPVGAGVYRMTLVPPAAGTYTGTLHLEGPPADTSDAVEGIAFRVTASNEVPPSEGAPLDHPASLPHASLIEFLKEQQWGVPFATAFAQEGRLIPSVIVSGRITTPPGGSAEVGAPVVGRIGAPPSGFPRPGDTVGKGQLLATLSPSPSSPEGAARASLALAEARARRATAQADLQRAAILLREQAISARAYEIAQREAEVAEEALAAAARSQALYTGADTRGTWPLTAPIAGTVTEVNATPGATASPQDTLFRVINLEQLWIRAKVPEHEAINLRPDRNADVLVSGADRWMPLTIEGPNANARVVTVGRTVDATSRTVDVIYAIDHPHPTMRVGGLVQVSLPAGDDFHGVVLPQSALLDQAGRAAVMVQIDGEHFVERSVRVGPRAGERVGILSGLAPGERVVIQGAHLIRLADRASRSVPHGHIH